MTLKEKLDAVWSRQRIACPLHRTVWSLEPPGWSYRIFEGLWHCDLYFNRGSLVLLKSKRKSKGYSYLCKNYQLEWKWINKP